MRARRSASWLNAALVLAAAAALVALERRRPLRRSVECRNRHDARNLGVAALGAVALQLAERPCVAPLAAMVERRRLGLVKQVPLPPWLEVPLALILMDYTLYLWHVLTHRVAWLWRFHLVHHVDRDLTASTALRFHFGELLLSVPWRAMQVAALGVSPAALRLWQTMLLLSILFHHSNLRLPPGVERRLVRFIMTPRLHGIHHSTVREEREANWSSGLTLWDRLHGTLKLDVPQDAITIGVSGDEAPRALTLGAILAMPFGRERPETGPHLILPLRGSLPLRPEGRRAPG
jgi:sterol desaturase/sphingolipid hydroxylase (fatty acid hydroxylase superfamily)